MTDIDIASDSAFAGRRILLVEDEVLVSMMLEDMLTDLGCEVVGPVGTITRALALAESVACDAAVLDVNLEGTESYPVADTLRRRGIPVIFATGYEGVRPEYRDSTCLQKPFKQPQLIGALARLLSR